MWLHTADFALKQTFLARKFCFSNTDHVMFAGEFPLCLFIIYAYIYTCSESNFKEIIP